MYILVGCENNCHGNGHCKLAGENYNCDCRSGWGGDHCSIPLETRCDDDKDNDGGK